LRTKKINIKKLKTNVLKKALPKKLKAIKKNFSVK